MAAMAGFPFLMVSWHVVSCILWNNCRSSCTLGLLADRVLRKAYEAMDVGLWIALLSALSSLLTECCGGKIAMLLPYTHGSFT